MHKNGDFAGEITLDKYARMFIDVYHNKKFSIRKSSNSDEIVIEADPVKHEENGHTWIEYGFSERIYNPGSNTDLQLLATHLYFQDRVRDVTDEEGSYSVVDLESAEDQRLAAEEYIAHLAQRGVPKPSWWKEFLNKIRMWWMSTGWGKSYPVTTDQIEILLARSSRKMRKHWYNRRSQVVIGGKTDLDGSSSAPIGAMEDGQGTDLRFDLFDNQEKSRKIFLHYRRLQMVQRVRL